MHYVQANKFTDATERELARAEAAAETSQAPFHSVTDAARFVVSLIAELKDSARRYDVDYANS